MSDLILITNEPKSGVSGPKAAKLSFWLRDDATGFEWQVEREIEPGQQIDWKTIVAEEKRKYTLYRAILKEQEANGTFGGQAGVQSPDNNL